VQEINDIYDATWKKICYLQGKAARKTLGEGTFVFRNLNGNFISSNVFYSDRNGK
jgi:hypothetical protein